VVQWKEYDGVLLSGSLFDRSLAKEREWEEEKNEGGERRVERLPCKPPGPRSAYPYFSFSFLITIFLLKTRTKTEKGPVTRTQYSQFVSNS
jgi:hypothetical protein